MKKLTVTAMVCAIVCLPLTLSTTRAAADDGNATASAAQIDALVADMKAHKDLCDKVTPSQATLYQQCSNEKARLVARQQALGLTDDALNDKLKTRGWRWP